MRLNQLLRIHVFKSHGPSGVPAEGQFHGLPVNQAVKNAEQLVHRWRKGQLDKTVWLPGYPLLTTAEDDPGRRDLKRLLNHQREQARLRARARRSCHQKALWRLFTSRFVKGGGLHFNLQGAPGTLGSSWGAPNLGLLDWDLGAGQQLLTREKGWLSRAHQLWQVAGKVLSPGVMTVVNLRLAFQR